MYDSDYVELDRRFFEIPSEYAQDVLRDNTDLSEIYDLRIVDDISWDELLKESRIVILAPAGAGKTREIKQAAIKLRKKNALSFFIRLEHISDNLEAAFDVGEYEEFNNWLNSTEEAWLFLDSVDESRLRDYQEFSAAVRKIANVLKPAMQRVHIFITGRFEKWDAETDLALCNDKFQYSSPNAQQQSPHEEIILTTEADDGAYNYAQNDCGESSFGKFKIYSISKLSFDQVAKFSKNKGAKDFDKFIQELERLDASMYVDRPDDLEHVILFWNKFSRIGSRLELMQNSIERRLEERRANAKVANPISTEKVLGAAKLIAGASTLMQQSVIKQPYSPNKREGIDTVKILENECSIDDCDTVLGRPLFDGAIYGTVRFYHKSARDYLTAMWLHDCLNKGASRKTIESLFFKRTYGSPVIVPSTRAILAWLAIFDKNIRNKACKTEPEIIFEDGDPSNLPLKIRRKVLKDVCKRIGSDASKRSVTDYSSVKRFANPDMASDIKILLKQYADNAEVISFLMRMIWQGRIKEALPEAKCVAMDQEVNAHIKIAAVRAIKQVGTDDDFLEFLTSLTSNDKRINRTLLANTINLLSPTLQSLRWILSALENVEDGERYSSDGLGYYLVRFVEKLGIDETVAFIKGIDVFLSRSPFIEKSFCHVSKQYSWLISSGTNAVEKLIKLRHPDTLCPQSLSILSKIRNFKEYEYVDSKTLTDTVSDAIQSWPEFNFSVFWKDVEETRKVIYSQKEDRLTYHWQPYMLRGYWSFGSDDFDKIKNEISSQTFLDNKLVALSLAFSIYTENGRPQIWRDQLKDAVSGEKELEERLNILLHPPAQSEEQKKWKQQEYRWKKQSKKREDEEKKRQLEWLEWLSNNTDKLRDKNLLDEILKKNQYLNAQYYLLEKMREKKDDHSHWTQGNWKDLIPDFGEDISKAFRDGLVLFWRLYTPIPRSQKDDENNTPISLIIGLAGLEIESKELDNWPNSLDEQEANLACLYALHELNGFPNWFSKLYRAFPKVVTQNVLNEIDWELNISSDGKERHYIIEKLSWSGQIIWDDIAPLLFERLKEEPISLKNLENLLKIIQESKTVSNQELSMLATRKCKELSNPTHLAYWFSAWIGVEPKAAIKAFIKYLKALKDGNTARDMAMNVVVNLTGDRMSGSHARENFKTPQHLKELYLVMYKYIKKEEDIDRSGKGAYSPNLRDHAQEARNGLFTLLTNITGKDAHAALIDLARKHPVKSYRSNMMRYAKERAEKDTHNKIWDYVDFKKFIDSFSVKVGYPMEEKYIIITSVAFFAASTTLLIWLATPTDTQYLALRTAQVLSVAGMGRFFSGFFHIEGKIQSFALRASGALGLATLFYLFAPAPPKHIQKEATIIEAPSEINTNEKETSK